MTYPSVTRSYAVAVGSASNRGQVAVFENRAPTSYNIMPNLGKLWIDSATNAAYLLTSLSGNPVTASWLSLGTAGGALNQLSDGSTTVTPTAGAIIIGGTASQITSTGSNAPGKITLSLPNAIVAPGSVTATTTLTATLGNITATNGNLNLAHTGNKILIHATTAASDSIGTSVALVSGTKTISTSAVTTNSKIFLTVNTLGTVVAPQAMQATNIVNGVSFDIVSADATDTSTVNYLIIN